MRPGTHDLYIYRNDSYTWTYRVWKDAARTIPADLTDVIAAAEIRPGAGLQPVTTLACTVTAPNVVDVHLAADNWDAITFQCGRWDLQLTYPDASVVTIVAGNVIVTDDITQSTLVAASTMAVSAR